MLLVQKYLETHSFADLAAEHGVYASFSKSGHKFSLNYDQIEAKESDPLAQECRGLILSALDGTSYLSQSIEVNDRRNYDSVVPGPTMVLAYPMNRFFNYGQGAAADVDWSDPHLRIMEKMDGCFDYDAQLNCWDGSSISIGKVIKNKLSPILIGKDDNGNLIPCHVTNWFDNGKKDNWLEITTSLKFHSKNRKFKVTSNHSLNINGVFIPAMNAKSGDTMLSYYDDICEWTKFFIRSSLLGDGSLSKNGKNYKFQEGHKIDHKLYSEQIIEWLGECFSCADNKVSGYGSKMYRVTSKPFPSISKLRKEWYVNDKKCIPQDLSWINDFSIAKWYMDDGSLCHTDNQNDRAHFATNGFSENDAKRLANKLNEMYGVNCSVYFSKGWNIRVNSGRKHEIDVFWKAISPYIVDCMLYKLPESFRKRQFNSNEKGYIVKNTSKVKILSIKKIEIKSKNNKKEFIHGRKGYDIETTSHNYFANSLLVHNSLTILYYDKFTEEWCVATRSVPEADITLDSGFYTFRTLFEKALKDTNGMYFSEFTKKLRKGVTYCFELTSPYNRIVVDYHESKITLIAARSMFMPGGLELELDDIETYGVPHVQAHTFTSVNDLLDWVSNQNPLEHEGVVVRDSQFRRLKMKNASYVAFNRARDILGTSERNCLELVLAGKEDDVIPALPPEIVDRIVIIKQGVAAMLKDYDRAYKTFKYASDQINAGDKKTFAIMVNGFKDVWSSPMFSMFDGKCSNMKGFIAINRKEGSWGNNFLDKILEIVKKY